MEIWEIKKLFEKKISNISNDYFSLAGGDICLDGWYSSKVLRQIADILDEYNKETDKEDKNEQS